MKRTFIFKAVCAAMAVASLAACKKDDPVTPGEDGTQGGGNAQYTLLATPLTVNFSWSDPAPQDVTVTTNAPDGFTVGETPEWFTATVSGNKVTLAPKPNEGDKRTYTLTISAEGANSVTIVVNQAAKGEIHESLKGEKYIVWQLDQTSTEYLGDKIILSLGDNGNDKKFFIWDSNNNGTGGMAFDAGTSEGPNFYGNQGYMGLVVGSIGWSGAGYVYSDEAGLNNAIPEFQQILDDKGEGWYFHAAVKGTPGVGSNFLLSNIDDSKSYLVSWDSYKMSLSEWAEIEIPMTTVLATGWTGPAMNTNNMIVRSSTKQGDVVQYDALFIYKKVTE